MTKLVLSNLTNLNNQASAVSTINANMQEIVTAVENTLSRDGTSPNQMQNILDMNGYSIINAVVNDDPSSLVTRSDAEDLFEEIFTEGYEDIIATIISDEQKGWSPVLSVVQDTTRRVLEVIDWTGGGGDKPTELGYIGVDGLVPDIEDGVDVRGEPGAAGAGSGDMLAANNLGDLDNPRLGRDNLGLATTTTDEALTRFDSTTGSTQNSTVRLDDTGAFTLPEMTTPSTPTTSEIKLYAKGDTLNILDGAGLERPITKIADDYQVFTSSGTWTKPSGFSANAVAIIEVWGAGGGGGLDGSGAYGGGGGGGGYNTRTMLLSALTSTVAVTVGTSATATTGGSSNFGSVFAYGGGRGGTRAGEAGGSGGGGGGPSTAGSAATAGQGGDGGALGAGKGGSTDILIPEHGSVGGGGGGAAGASGVTAQSGGDGGIYGGGGGGGGQRDGGATGGNGGRAIFGGGGGGSRGDSSVGFAGTSVNGGNGGVHSSAGSAPGGGGGANAAGARGEVRVRVRG